MKRFERRERAAPLTLVMYADQMEMTKEFAQKNGLKMSETLRIMIDFFHDCNTEDAKLRRHKIELKLLEEKTAAAQIEEDKAKANGQQGGRYGLGKLVGGGTMVPKDTDLVETMEEYLARTK